MRTTKTIPATRKTPATNPRGTAAGMRWRVSAAGVALAGLAAAVAGCAPLAKEECRATDAVGWQAIGLVDGLDGKAAGQLQTYRGICAKVGSVPDDAAWRAGYAQGLESYCVPSRMHRKGMSGLSFPNVCAADQAALQPAYDWGRGWWDIQLNLMMLRADLRQPDIPSRSIMNSARYDRLRREQIRHGYWPPR